MKKGPISKLCDYVQNLFSGRQESTPDIDKAYIVEMLKHIPTLNFFITQNPKVIEDVFNGHATRESVVTITTFMSTDRNRSLYGLLIGASLAPENSPFYVSSRKLLLEQLRSDQKSDATAIQAIYLALEVLSHRPKLVQEIRNIMKAKGINEDLTL